MDVVIDQTGCPCKHFCFGKSAESFQLFVDTGSCLEMYMSFIAEDTGLHVLQIVLLAFLESFDIPFLLHFHSLQIVAWVIFV